MASHPATEVPLNLQTNNRKEILGSRDEGTEMKSALVHDDKLMLLRNWDQQEGKRWQEKRLPGQCQPTSQFSILQFSKIRMKR